MKNAQQANQEKTGRKIVSLSLMLSDAIWVDQVLEEINSQTKRKITRSEIIAVAINALKEKPIDKIIEIIKNR